MDNDTFGTRVDTYGNTIIVSFPKDDYAGLTNAGSVYVYEKTNGTWNLNTILQSPITTHAEGFGSSLAIHKDMITISTQYHNVDTHTSTGCVYVYTRSSSTWKLTATVTATVPLATVYLGISVDIYDNTMIVGSGNSSRGVVYFFNKTNQSTWEQTAFFEGGTTYEYMEGSVALYHNYAIAGAPHYTLTSPTTYVDAGKIYVFHYDNGSWSKASMGTSPIIRDDDYYGSSIAISDDYIVAGTHRYKGSGQTYYGAVSIYERIDTFLWASGTREDLFPTDTSNENWFGTTVALYENMLVVGCPNNGNIDNGSVYLYTSSADNAWTLFDIYTETTIANHTDGFGNSVALSDKALVVGAPDYDLYENGVVVKNNIGAVYIYE